MLCDIFKTKKYIFLAKFKNGEIIFYAPENALQGVKSLSIWKKDKKGYKCHIFGKVIKDNDLNKMLEITHFKPPRERKFDLEFLQLEKLDIYAIV